MKQDNAEKRIKAINKILNTKSGSKFRLKFAPIIDGKQYICDGFSMVVLNSPLELPAPPSDMELSVYKKLADKNQPKSNAIDVTDRINPTDLKQEVSEIKAFFKGSQETVNPIVAFALGNDEYVYINAHYLLRMIDIFPNAKITVSGHFQPICFESADGFGFICPIHHDESTQKRNIIKV